MISLIGENLLRDASDVFSADDGSDAWPYLLVKYDGLSPHLANHRFHYDDPAPMNTPISVRHPPRSHTFFFDA